MTNIISITVSYNGQYELLSDCNTSTMTLHDIILFSVALLNIEYDNNQYLELYKDSQLLYIETSEKSTATLPTKRALPSTTTLHDASINNGDLLVIRMVNPNQQQQQQQQTLSSNTNNNQLDFSQLLGTSAAATPSTSAPAIGGGLDFSSLLAPSNNTNNNNNRALASSSLTPSQPQYYPNMSLDEVMHYNPHPLSFITLLYQYEHLYKELNYHNPTLARKLKRPDNTFISMDNAVIIWRDELVKVNN